MSTLLFFAFCVALFIYRDQVVLKKDAIEKILQLIPTFVNAANEYEQQLKKNGVPDAEIDKVKFVIDEVNKIASAFSIVLDPKTTNLIQILSSGYSSVAAAKIDLTKAFYNVLNSGSANEEQVYNLTYIFNRFLGDVFVTPYNACLDAAYRFYKFLKYFHYL